jgi:hypothetical protein
MTDTPSNIEEFNRVAGLVFAQLYSSFPTVVDIDRGAIAKAMGVEGNDWSNHKLPSGRTLGQVVTYTIAWLNAEGYIRAAGSHPAERVILSKDGLAAMNQVPSGLKQSVGTALVQQTSNLSGLGDFMGGFFGGFTKSMGT